MTYPNPLVEDPASDAEALDWLFGISLRDATPEYRVQAYRAAVTGDLLEDLSSDLSKQTGDIVRYDSGRAVPADCRISLDATRSLVWGSDIVALFQLIRSVEFNRVAGFDETAWLRYPVGHFVLTSPGFSDLDASDVRLITGYDKNYLLQTSLGDSMAWDAGTKYKDLVEDVFQAAGLVTSALAEVCDYPGGAALTDWPNKTLPDPVNYDFTTNVQYLSIINEQLKASGCRPLYVQANGRWQITTVPKPAQQALLWRWAGSRAASVTEEDLDRKIVLSHAAEYSGDVWGVPNQWVFVQQGLSFTPVEGSGKYTVNNTTQPPSDQTTTGRIIRATQALQASGQDDLVTQGDAIVQDALAQAERISLTTESWPVAGHFDVFTFVHAGLPFAEQRRLQAQSWELDLWGGPMKWTTNAVAVT